MQRDVNAGLDGKAGGYAEKAAQVDEKLKWLGKRFADLNKAAEFDNEIDRLDRLQS